MKALNKQNLEMILKMTAITLVAGLSLIGCGSQKLVTTPTITPVSTNGVDLGSTLPKAIASCSHDVENQSELSVRMETYRNQTGQEDTTQVRVKFDRFLSNFNQSAHAINFYSVTYDSNGVARPSKRVGFRIEYKSASGYVALSPYEYQDLTWGDLQAILTANKLSFNTAKEALGNVIFRVNLADSANDAKVLIAAIYLDNGGPSAQVKALIPKFYANPSDYAIGKPQVLRDMHPLRDMIGGTWTASQYESESRNFCIQ